MQNICDENSKIICIDKL